MTAITVSDKLANEIRQEAQARGIEVEDLLKKALRRERTLAERKKIEREQSWWLDQPLAERAKFSGQFVAVHNQTLVDSDSDNDTLTQRIRARYGRTPVLIIPAEGPREINYYSNRIISE